MTDRAKCFDKKTAEYFASGRRKIIGVVSNDDYTLILTFDNGETRGIRECPQGSREDKRRA